MKRRPLRALFSALLLSAPLLVCVSLGGCSRGVLKGPEGQDDQGLGFKIPVLKLFEKKTYDAGNFAPDNLDTEEVNPFREKKDPAPATYESFSRYEEEW